MGSTDRLTSSVSARPYGTARKSISTPRSTRLCTGTWMFLGACAITSPGSTRSAVNPALQFNSNLRFYDVDNDALICYGKSTPDMTNLIVVIVNLDPSHTHSGWARLPVQDLH